jgi:hypothetical protein
MDMGHGCPGFYALIASFAISLGVMGRWGLMVGVWMLPVIAAVIIAFDITLSSLV